MTNKLSVLWIEDGAQSDLPYLAAPVFMSGRFDLVVAEDISQAVAHMLSREFQVVILDIRMPPGSDPRWIKLFQDAGSSKVDARLGLKLLYSLLRPDKAPLRLDQRPDWITAEKIGMLTVEILTELQTDLDMLGIRAFRQKTAGMSYRVLLELIEEVLQQQAQAN